jgi:hypothetical protein
MPPSPSRLAQSIIKFTMAFLAHQHAQAAESSKNARFFDTLDTRATGLAWMSNNSFEKSLCAWLLCRRFFDTQYLASFLKAIPSPSQSLRAS